MVMGGRRELMSDALQVFSVRVRRFGDDVLLSGSFNEHPY